MQNIVLYLSVKLIEMKKQNITIKLKNMSKNSGVYKMLDRAGNVIYIGKAKNLKNRVSQYFNQSNNNIKIQAAPKEYLRFFCHCYKNGNAGTFIRKRSD